MENITTVSLSRRGVRLALRIQQHLGGIIIAPERCADSAGPNATLYAANTLSSYLKQAFVNSGGLVLIMPTGAAVRLLAPLLRDKRHDPAVVVLDEGARHAVALLSNHLGGGNQLARQVAEIVGATPVITTASDVLGVTALDLLAQEQGWTVESDHGLTRASSALVDDEPVGCYQDGGDELWWEQAPANLTRYASIAELANAEAGARVVITDRLHPTLPPAGVGVVFRPKTLVAGVGCVRGATADEIGALITKTLAEHQLSPASLRAIATIDVKRDESGITDLALRLDVPVQYYSAAELSAVDAPSGGSSEVNRTVGTPAVCEPAALLAAQTGTLVIPKTKTARVTVAVARLQAMPQQGTLAVVGIGPGAPEDMTLRARTALERAEAVVGYGLYLDMLRPWLRQKQYYASLIGEETVRCRLAISLMRAGKQVALVSSGDAGIYGMAGLVFELLAEEGVPADMERVTVVPGVSAAQAAAAALGAPLMSDYATISLSDLMTPWEVIKQRLQAAAGADLVVALYNPASKRRQQPIARAQAIFLARRPPDTPVALVYDVTRPGQHVTVTDLQRLLEYPITMLTLVIIGNSKTNRWGDRLVTKRGYHPESAPLP